MCIRDSKEKDPSKGYNQLLDYRMEKILPLMAKNKVKVITNMGAANPVSAAERTCEIARKLGVGGLKIACVTGDDKMCIRDSSSTVTGTARA